MGDPSAFLADGQILTLTYTLTSDDGNGGTDAQDVTITIAGTNDGPIAFADSGTTEGGFMIFDVADPTAPATTAMCISMCAENAWRDHSGKGPSHAAPSTSSPAATSRRGRRPVLFIGRSR